MALRSDKNKYVFHSKALKDTTVDLVARATTAADPIKFMADASGLLNNMKEQITTGSGGVIATKAVTGESKTRNRRMKGQKGKGKKSSRELSSVKYIDPVLRGTFPDCDR